MASRSSSGLLSVRTVSSGGGATRRAFQSVAWENARAAREHLRVIDSSDGLSSPSSLSTSPARSLDENVDFSTGGAGEDDEETGLLGANDNDAATVPTAVTGSVIEATAANTSITKVFRTVSPVISATPSVRATPVSRRVVPPLSARRLAGGGTPRGGGAAAGGTGGSMGCALSFWGNLGRVNGGAELQALLPIAAPVMASSCLLQLLNIADLLYVGNYLGPEYLAAAALGQCWFNILSALLLGGASGLDELLSAAIERNDGHAAQMHSRILLGSTRSTGQSQRRANAQVGESAEAEALPLPPAAAAASLLMPPTLSSASALIPLSPISALGNDALAITSLLSSTPTIPTTPMPQAKAQAHTFPSPLSSRSEIGLLAQRGIGIMVLAAAPLVVIGLWATEGFLVEIGRQDPSLSASAAGFCDALVIGLLPLTVSTSLARYMAAAGHTWAVIAVDLAANGLNLTLNTALVGVDSFLGAPLATSAARFAHLIMLVAFFRARASSEKTLRDTWPGWQPAVALGDGEGVLKMAKSMLKGAAAVALESWPLELSYLLVGLLDVPSLDAHCVALNTCVFISLGFPNGLGVAAGARLPALLSAGDAVGARRLALVALTATLAYNLIAGLLLLALGRHMGDLFTGDAEVSETVAQVSLAAAAFQVADGAQCTLGGILRGLGLVRAVTTLRFAGMVAVGLPAAAVGGFVLKGGLVGIWVGLLAGVGCTALALAALFGAVDWDVEAAKAVAVAADAARLAVRGGWGGGEFTPIVTPFGGHGRGGDGDGAPVIVRLRRSTKEMAEQVMTPTEGNI